jgi:uncharacterized membrane protein/protein-disulfide isomerase
VQQIRSRVRIGLLALALAGLFFSGWATAIHHRLLVDPRYVSPCDINARFNCSEVYLSAYGAVKGVPVALGGVIWFALVASVVAFVRPTPGRRNQPAVAYVYVLSWIGLAAITYLAYASFFVLGTVCLLCLATYVCVLGILITSAWALSIPLSDVPSALAADLRQLVASPMRLAIGVLLVGATGWAVLAFPRTFSASAASGPPKLPISASAATSAEPVNDPRVAFEEIWAKQPRVDVGIPSEGAKVVIVKFLDWECVGCKAAHEWYQAVLDHFAQAMPGAVKYVERDFPLHPRCNFDIPRAVHPAPCEAAAAVRLAADRGKRDQMVNWILANQSSDAAAVKAEAKTLLGIADFDQQYATKLPAIRQDIADGVALHVGSTPTIYVNGVMVAGTVNGQPIPTLAPQYLQIGIEYEIRHAGR